MKKLVTLLCFASFVFAVYAQAPQVKTKSSVAPLLLEQRMPDNSSTDPMGNSMLRVDDSEWYSFTDALEYYYGTDFWRYSFVLFPDSIVRNVLKDVNGNDSSYSYAFMHSVGQLIDPRDETFGFYGNYGMKENQPYTVDSLRINYFYDRYTDNSVVDTLVFQYYIANILPYTWTSDKEPFGTIKVNNKTRTGVGYTKEIKIPLTEADTHALAGRFFKSMLIPVGVNNPHGGVFGYTLTYKPGNSYQWDDTLGRDGVTTYRNKLNTFRYRHEVDEQQNTAITSMSNGLFMNSQVIDANPDAGWGLTKWGNYIPGSGWTHPYYVYSLFKLTFDKDYIGVPEFENGIAKIGKVFPNPSTGISSLAVKLENTAAVSVDLINPLGQSVRVIEESSFTTGEHNLELITSDLKPGVYFVKVNVGEFSSTQRLLVQ